ncbi:Protein of unknown function [Cotesia congregata]|uniref:Uncharacterized protein n=1 Tax=Cotesia congregata TaxID=51543 RepID=A0A8J2MZZ7_COTCN|nr:Protein of unknown function [Cotesia congregata]
MGREPSASELRPARRQDRRGCTTERSGRKLENSGTIVAVGKQYKSPRVRATTRRQQNKAVAVSWREVVRRLQGTLSSLVGKIRLWLAPGLISSSGQGLII